MRQKITQATVSRMDVDRGRARERRREIDFFIERAIETNELESRVVWSVHVEKS
jgi:hypothetical protein